jgi:hypothetical protein
MPSPIELVIEEAKSRGLRTERLSAQSRRHVFDKRLLMVEGKRCQVIPSRRGHPSAQYPHAEYFPLYLPRTDWPDFLIYVSLTDEARPMFRVVPRVEMSKDTGLSPESLECYRDTWELLRQVLPDSEKEFEILSWQLQAVEESAKYAGLEIEHIKTKKHQDGREWPPVIKRRILIAGKKCAIFSAARISQDPEKREYNYAHFRASQEDWPEFQLYVIKGADNSSDIFVVPRDHLITTTSASLDHPELARYKNAWNLLIQKSEALAAVPPIRWREPKVPPAPTKHAKILQETVRRAESQGLIVESADSDVTSHKGVQSFLYISKKRCQVIQSSVITVTKRRNVFEYLPLNPPASEWPEFLIFYATRPDDPSEATFYIIPRTELPRHTSRSLSSKWLKQYLEAWQLLDCPDSGLSGTRG